MNTERLYEILDIETPDDFRFYENFDALMEEEEHIEEDLITELFKVTDNSLLYDHVSHFFESLMSNIPDDESELYILIDAFRGNIFNAVADDMDDEELTRLASEICKFRKWYAIDHNAVDSDTGEELSIRDARYELMAAGFLGEDKTYDFTRALTSGPDAYEVNIRDIIG